MRWIIRCVVRKKKSGRIISTLCTGILIIILYVFLLFQDITYSLRVPNIVCATVEKIVNIQCKQTTRQVLIWSFLKESFLSPVPLGIDRRYLQLKRKWQPLAIPQARKKKNVSSNAESSRILIKYLGKGKLKYLPSSRGKYDQFVRRRKDYKYFCLRKESNLLYSRQMVLVMWQSFIIKMVLNREICISQTMEVGSGKFEACLNTLHDMGSKIRTTILFSCANTKDRRKFEEDRKSLQSDIPNYQYTTHRCLEVTLQRQVLSNTIKEINQEIVFSSKPRSKSFFLHDIEMNQQIQIYPVQQFSLEQAFTSCAEGGQIITNPAFFFSNNLARLSSYRNFPSERAPSAIKLSNAGFYATGNDDETACFYCGCRYSRWRPNDDPVQIHENFSPECEFVQEISSIKSRNQRTEIYATNGILCSEEMATSPSVKKNGDSLIVFGNEPFCRRSSIAKEEMLNDRSSNHCCNISRENSTEDFPKVQEILTNGKESNYTSQMDPPSTTYSSCGSQSISLDNSPSTVPLPVPSERSSSSAPCFPCIEKVPLNEKSDQQKKGRDLGTNGETSVRRKRTDGTFMKPLFPKYTNLLVRMSSFAKWPTHAKQTAKEMAEAGFFYKGYSDAVVCFWCGVCIASWEDEDEPCIEHIKWQPLCQYTIQTKGQDFVDLVLEQQNRFHQNEKNIIDYNVAEQTLSSKFSSSEEKHSRLKEMGFQQEDINAAVRIVSRQKEKPTDEDILEQLLNDDMQREITETRPPIETSFPHAHDQQNATPNDNYAASVNGSEDRDHLSRVERLICKICMTQEVNVTFIPCGHLICCQECSGMVSKCPVCRARIENRIKSFIS